MRNSEIRNSNFRPMWLNGFATMLATLTLLLGADSFSHTKADLESEFPQRADAVNEAGQVGTLIVPRFVSFDSVDSNEVCGIDIAGQSICHRGSGGVATVVPDAVGRLREGYSNYYMSCGFDEVGTKCWRLPQPSGSLEATATDYRSLFENAVAGSISTSAYIVCAVEKTSGDLACAIPSWRRARIHRIKPRQSMGVHASDDSIICWADGDKVDCLQERTTTAVRADMILPGIKEMIVTASWVCARNATEGKCWALSSSRTTVNLDSSMLGSAPLVRLWSELCAVQSDKSVKCIDPLSGRAAPAKVPSKYTGANSDVLQLWRGRETGCVLTTSNVVECWNRYYPNSPKVRKFDGTIDKLFGASDAVCGLYADGRAECGTDYTESITLQSGDRVRVMMGSYNKCFWNAFGLDCRGRTDSFSFKSVRAISPTTWGDPFCVVGIKSDDPIGFEGLYCSSNYSYTVPQLTNPSLVALTDYRGCATSDEGLSCWGDPWTGNAPMPTNIYQPSKLQVETSYGCLLDAFGFTCWGDLDSNGLQIPAGLEQQGKVKDFAISPLYACAVLDTGKLQCWGRRVPRLPVLNGATAIISRKEVFCSADSSGLHCWGGYTSLPF